MYTIDVFKNLIKLYDTWDKLIGFLESEEGGLLRIADNSEEYAIIRYDKEISIMDLPHVPFFKSVVWHKTTNRPVCMAPSRTESGAQPFKTVADLWKSNVTISECLDGFMVNYFYDKLYDNCHICTRSKLNATGQYYSIKSFDELFHEAFIKSRDLPDNAITRHNTILIELLKKELNKTEYIEGERARFYTVHVQHPDYRVVTPVNEPRIHNIQSGSVFEDGSICINNIFDGITFNLQCLSSEWITEDYLKEFIQKAGWKFRGFMISDPNSSRRWKVESEEYKRVHSLRSLSSDNMIRYYKLREQKLVATYLTYYPEDMAMFEIFEMHALRMVSILYNYYLAIHVLHKINIYDVDKIYHPHLYAIHSYYLTKLKGKCEVIRKAHIDEYLRRIPWQRVLFLIYSE